MGHEPLFCVALAFDIWWWLCCDAFSHCADFYCCWWLGFCCNTFCWKGCCDALAPTTDVRTYFVFWWPCSDFVVLTSFLLWLPIMMTVFAGMNLLWWLIVDDFIYCSDFFFCCDELLWLFCCDDVLMMSWWFRRNDFVSPVMNWFLLWWHGFRGDNCFGFDVLVYVVATWFLLLCLSFYHSNLFFVCDDFPSDGCVCCNDLVSTMMTFFLLWWLGFCSDDIVSVAMTVFLTWWLCFWCGDLFHSIQRHH